MQRALREVRAPQRPRACRGPGRRAEPAPIAGVDVRLPARLFVGKARRDTSCGLPAGGDIGLFVDIRLFFAVAIRLFFGKAQRDTSRHACGRTCVARLSNVSLESL